MEINASQVFRRASAEARRKRMNGQPLTSWEIATLNAAMGRIPIVPNRRRNILDVGGDEDEDESEDEEEDEDEEDEDEEDEDEEDEVEDEDEEDEVEEEEDEDEDEDEDEGNK